MRITIDSFFPGLTRSTVDSLGHYLDVMEQQLEAAKLDAQERVLQDSQDDLAEWQLAMQQHTVKHDMFFLNFFRYSFVVLAILVVEDRLCRLSRIVARKRGGEAPSPGSEVLKGYRRYLVGKKVCVPEALWGPVHDLNKLRNCVVHAGGKVNASNNAEHLRVLADREPGLEISRPRNGGHPVPAFAEEPLFLEDGMLAVGPEYCRKAVDSIRQLLQALCDAVPLHGLVMEEDS